MNENPPKRHVFTCITCLANSQKDDVQIRCLEHPLMNIEGLSPSNLTPKKIDSWSYKFKKPTRKNKDHLKKCLLPFFKTEVFQMIFCLAPLKGRSPRRSPLCVFGGWTGVFHSAGCQWSDIDSLLAPPLIFFLGTDLYAQCRKKRQKAAVSIFWGGDFKIVIFQGTGNGRMLLLVVDDAHFKKESMESLAMLHIHVFFLKRKSFAPRLLRMYGIMYILFFCIHIFTR